MNYSRFINSLSKNRKPSTIRELTNLLVNASPELVFLGGGLPNPQLFPFEEASFKLRDGKEIKLQSQQMTSALQYGPTPGYPPLVTQLKSLVKRLHSPPLWNETDVVVTPGSQDGLCKAIEMLVNFNDFVVTQTPCYTGTLAILNPYKPRYLSVGGDNHGMKPDSLRLVLSQWQPEDIKDKEEGVPKILYINPNAANPSGISISSERRREIYEICSSFNLIILEDDPYYFVQFEDQKNFSPSFLSLDIDGRVLRFDSFSKILSSGIRLGFVTGPKPLIRTLMLHMQASVLHASSMSQVMVSELMNLWTEDGFLEHTVNVQKFYKERRDVMLAAADKHLTGLCEWSVPTGGMFLWLKAPDLTDTWDMIMEKGVANNVVLVPGKAFMPDSEAPCQYMRAAFSLATPEKMDLGMKYLAKLIREEIEISKK